MSFRGHFTFSTFLRSTCQYSTVRLRCRKDQIEGIPVYLLDKESGPFSFFHWIFIYPQAHPQNELSEILTHEGTHARQRHSIDVIISELMCIACWFNPFMWLMKREVRNNLEYMADNRVLEAGHDSYSLRHPETPAFSPQPRIRFAPGFLLGRAVRLCRSLEVVKYDWLPGERKCFP